MADQGHWFKLWVTALHDPDLSNLPLEDFARWAILGTYVKAHGTEGKLTLTSPARALCALFQVPDFAALRAVFHRLPNVHEEMHGSPVSPETVSSVSLSVSLRNWAKYQGDYSTERVRRFRAKNDQMKRSKRRGEEKRGEERRREEKLPPVVPHESNGHGSSTALRADARSLLVFLNEKTGRSYRPVPANLKLIEARLKSGASVADCRGVIARKCREWGTDPKMSEYLRPETLFNATKFESYRGQQEAET